jgi:hypothetical protein
MEEKRILKELDKIALRTDEIVRLLSEVRSAELKLGDYPGATLEEALAMPESERNLEVELRKVYLAKLGAISSQRQGLLAEFREALVDLDKVQLRAASNLRAVRRHRQVGTRRRCR